MRQATTLIAAPPSPVWAILADIGTISRWNPGVRHSESTSDARSGEGATRHCDLPGGPYPQERAVDWIEGESFRIEILDSNLPLPHSTLRFTIEPADGGTRVVVKPEYEPSAGRLGSLLDRLLVRRLYDHGFDDLLRGLKEHAESEAADDRTPETEPAAS